MYAKHYKGHGDFWSLILYHYVSQDSWKRAYSIKVNVPLNFVTGESWKQFPILNAVLGLRVLGVSNFGYTPENKGKRKIAFYKYQNQITGFIRF